MKRILLGLAALLALAFVAEPAAAQFVGQPMWRSDPTGACQYPGRANCPDIVANEPGTMLAVTSGVVAAATSTATSPAIAAKTNYLTGISITGGGATAASLVTCTITGLLGGTISYIIPVPAGATLGISPISRTFITPLPASATNVAIVTSCPTFGAGNTAAVVNQETYSR